MERSKSNVSDPFARAVRILAHRDHSEAELRHKLARFGFSASVLDEVIERCYRYNYLDDRRFALTRCREMLRTGRGVGIKILLDLRRRGVRESLAQEALEEACREYPAEEVLRQQLERRFPDFNYATAEQKERRRVVSFFQRRGFSLDEIFTTLKKGPVSPATNSRQPGEEYR